MAHRKTRERKEPTIGRGDESSRDGEPTLGQARDGGGRKDAGRAAKQPDSGRVGTVPGPKPVPGNDKEPAAADPAPARQPKSENRPAGEAAEARLRELEGQVAELREQLLRALAETENTRRRLQKEKEDAGNFAIAGFAKDMLTVADNLRRALESVPREKLAASPTLKTLVEGVELTEGELLAAFRRHGIEKIEPQGEKFDHNFHQAMMQIEDSDQPDGTVAQVMAPGYVIKGRLLRPAMVGVAKGGKPKPGVDTSA